MRKVMKCCCSYVLGIVLAGSMLSNTVQAAKDSKKVTTPSGIAIDKVENKVDTFVKDYIGDRVAGAVVVAVKDNQVIFNKAYGESDLEGKTAVNVKDTTFELGTLTRMYTWTAVMQQKEAGKIDLNADILTYLPDDFKNKLKKNLKSDTPITMMNLINNTAGFEETGFDITVSDPKWLNGNLKDALLATMPKQIYNPGEVMTGSSYCSALAGYIVQCVTGMEFSDYVSKNIFEKAGMTSSTILANTKATDLGKHKAAPYSYGNEGTFRKTEYAYSNLYPSAGLVTNGEDFAKFIREYVKSSTDGTSLLKPETVKEMQKQTYAINENAKGQCIGLYEYPCDNVQAYYHDGTSNGYSSMMTIVPESGFGIGILTNSSISTEFMYGLTNLLLIEDGKSLTKREPFIETMPSIDEYVQSSFTGAKRSYHNALEFVGYFGNSVKFTKGDDDMLVLDTHKYRQIKPYVFEYAGCTKEEAGTVLTSTVAKYLYFGHNEKGKVTKWSYGGSGAGEYVVDENSNAQANLSLSILVLLLAGLFCAIMFSTCIILTAIDWIHKKPVFTRLKGAFRISIFLFVGLLINVATQTTKLIETTLLASKEFYWHTVANYGLTAALVISLAYFGYRYKKENSKPVKLLLYGTQYAFITLFIYLMYIWKFFVFA